MSGCKLNIIGKKNPLEIIQLKTNANEERAIKEKKKIVYWGNRTQGGVLIRGRC